MSCTVNVENVTPVLGHSWEDGHPPRRLRTPLRSHLRAGEQVGNRTRGGPGVGWSRPAGTRTTTVPGTEMGPAGVWERHSPFTSTTATVRRPSRRLSSTLPSVTSVPGHTVRGEWGSLDWSVECSSRCRALRLFPGPTRVGGVTGARRKQHTRNERTPPSPTADYTRNGSHWTPGHIYRPRGVRRK